MIKKENWFYLLLFIILTSLFLSACSSGDTNESNGETSDDNNAGKTQLAENQVLRINISTEPPVLNPSMVSDTTSAGVLKAVFEGLVRINPDGELENAQAKEIKVSDDNLTYTITLRDDAKWSNGDPVTANDFAYAWKWMLNPDHKAPKSFRLYPIKNAEEARTGDKSADEVGINVVDEKTFKVTLEKPTPYFKQLLAMPTFFPVNAEVAKANPDWYQDAGSTYVSNGPFVLDSWKHKDEIVLKKNTNCWDKDNVKLEKISMVMVNDPNTELNMYDSGKLDWAGGPLGGLPLATIPSAKEEGILTAFPISGKNYITINTNKKPFNNAKIRKAFALSINREGIVENILQGGQIPSMSFIPSPMWEENKQGYFEDNNAEKAKELLKKGMKELGIEKLPTITYSYNTDEINSRIAVALQEMWKDNLGVDVQLENNEWKVYLNKVREGNYMLGRMGGVAEYNDPTYFFGIWKETGGNNFTDWHSDEYAELLQKSSVESDPKKRNEILKKAEEIYMDAMPIIPLYNPAIVFEKKDYVKDVYVSNLGGIDFKWAYIAEH